MSPENPPLRSFVAGATGYTGRALMVEFAAAQLVATAHIRDDSSSEVPSFWTEPPLGVLRCPWHESAMRRALHEAAPNCVFSLLGTTRKRAQQLGVSASEAYAKVDRDLTLMLYHAAAALADPPVFIYLSAMGVSKSSKNPYLVARCEVEEILRSGPLPFVIVRPAFITGPDRAESRPAERFAASAIDAALTGLGFLGFKRLGQRYASLDATSLARGLLRCAQDRTVYGSEVDAQWLRAAAHRSC